MSPDSPYKKSKQNSRPNTGHKSRKNSAKKDTPGKEGEIFTGVISTIFGAYYNVLPLPDLNEVLRGRLRGRLRLEKARQKGARHLLMVGDHVEYSRSQKGAEVTIEALLPRKNSVFRAAGPRAQALGANLSRAIMVTSLTMPEPNFRFIDRFLTSCHAGGVPAALVFSKIDLLDQSPESEYKLAMAELYEELGYPVFKGDFLSTGESSQDLQELLEYVDEGVSLLVGRSGAGKSTLLNRLIGRPVQKTGDISQSTRKGKHTTTNSHLIVKNPPEKSGDPLEQSRAPTMFIDTPGLKEWGVYHLDRLQIIESFPEFEAHIKECRFGNCRHDEDDEGCEVSRYIQERQRLFASFELSDDDENDEEADETSSAWAPEDESGELMPERLESLEAMLESLNYTAKIRTGDYIKPTGRLHKERPEF